MLGNFICPTIAGIQAATFGWRWAYYTVGIALTALFILFLFFYEETKYVPATTGCAAMSGLADPGSETPGTPDFASHSPSDDKRQEQVCSLTTSPTYTATSRPPPPPNSYRQRMRFITPSSESLWRNYLTPFKMAVFPHVLFAAVQCANVITFLVYLASVNSIVFSGAPYNFSTAGVGLMFVGPFIGNMIGSVYGGLLGDMVVVRLARKNNGVFEPEMRLYILILPAILVGAGLMVFGVAAHRVSTHNFSTRNRFDGACVLPSQLMLLRVSTGFIPALAPRCSPLAWAPSWTWHAQSSLTHIRA